MGIGIDGNGPNMDFVLSSEVRKPQVALRGGELGLRGFLEELS
jgi:hypothetical protein